MRGLALAFVIFSDSGYDYCSNDYHVLFTEDKEHSHLFDYVSKDLSQLPMLLEEYVSKKMDITTFDLKSNYRYDDTDRFEIIEILKSLHPYYEHEYFHVFIKAIGEYFNSSLLHSNYINKIFDNPYTEKWYLKRFKEIAPFLNMEDNYRYPDKYYTEYIIQYKITFGNADYESNKSEFIYNPVTIPAQGFIQELRTQEYIKRMLFWILDISLLNIGKLTIPQRIWLYENIVHRAYGQSRMNVTRHLIFQPTRLFRRNNDIVTESNNIHEMDVLFEPLYFLSDLSDLNINSEDFPSEILNDLNHAVDRAKMVSEAKVNEEYNIKNLHQLLYLEIFLMIQSGTRIKKCKYCNMYFVVSDKKKAYCNRIRDGEKESCAMVGSRRTYQKKMNNDPALKMFSRAYRTHYARIKSGSMTVNEFSIWYSEAKKCLENVRAEKLNISIFKKWLKE